MNFSTSLIFLTVFPSLFLQSISLNLPLSDLEKHPDNPDLSHDTVAQNSSPETSTEVQIDDDQKQDQSHHRKRIDPADVTEVGTQEKTSVETKPVEDTPGAQQSKPAEPSDTLGGSKVEDLKPQETLDPIPEVSLLEKTSDNNIPMDITENKLEHDDVQTLDTQNLATANDPQPVNPEDETTQPKINDSNDALNIIDDPYKDNSKILNEGQPDTPIDLNVNEDAAALPVPKVVHDPKLPAPLPNKPVVGLTQDQADQLLHMKHEEQVKFLEEKFKNTEFDLKSSNKMEIAKQPTGVDTDLDHDDVDNLDDANLKTNELHHIDPVIVDNSQQIHGEIDHNQSKMEIGENDNHSVKGEDSMQVNGETDRTQSDMEIGENDSHSVTVEDSVQMKEELTGKLSVADQHQSRLSEANALPPKFAKSTGNSNMVIVALVLILGLAWINRRAIVGMILKKNNRTTRRGFDSFSNASSQESNSNQYQRCGMGMWSSFTQDDEKGNYVALNVEQNKRETKVDGWSDGEWDDWGDKWEGDQESQT